MSFKNWECYIYNKFDFYIQQRPVERSDSEFPWEMLAARNSSIKSRLKKMPFLYDTYRMLKGTPEGPRAILKDQIEPLYEARCLLGDEMSRLLYDEAVIIRLVSYNRFFFPRTAFEPLVDIVGKVPFWEPGYPDKYLGLPIEKNALILEPGLADTPLHIIASEGFAEFLNNWRQYLISREALEFRPISGDVVFDCGACIGDMSVIFAGLVGPTGQVHTFDPIPLHNRFCELQSKLNPSLSKSLIFNQLAVGKEVRKVTTGVKSDSDTIVPGGLDIDNFDMTTLDHHVSSHDLDRVDFIKMDIEGAEEDALAGAENLIREFKPKLAISTYHRPDDFWSLPLQIKKINPHYEFAFGHHSPLRWESVIYAYER